MAMDFDDESRAFSAYQTVLEMLEDRGKSWSAGYYISKEVKEFSKDAFSQKYKFDDGIIIIAPKRYSTENIIVNFLEDKKAISHKSLENISTKMKENKIFDGIIVSNAPLSSSAEKVLFGDLAHFRSG